MYANAVVMLAELVKSYEQLTAQLELQIAMAKRVPVDMSLRTERRELRGTGYKLPTTDLQISVLGFKR